MVETVQSIESGLVDADYGGGLIKQRIARDGGGKSGGYRSAHLDQKPQDFIEHQKNKEMLAQINAAYADEPDATEQTLRRKSRRQHRRIVEEKW